MDLDGLMRNITISADSGVETHPDGGMRLRQEARLGARRWSILQDVIPPGIMLLSASGAPLGLGLSVIYAMALRNSSHGDRVIFLAKKGLIKRLRPAHPHHARPGAGAAVRSDRRYMKDA